MTTSRDAILPSYTMREPNEQISILNGIIECKCKSAQIKGDGAVYHRWLPHPQICFSMDGKFSIEDMKTVIQNSCEVSTSLWTSVRKAHVTNWRMGSTCSVTGLVEDSIEEGDQNDLSYLKFHLCNFHQYYGDSISKELCHWTRGLTFESEEWNITIDSISEVDFNQVANSRGFMLTHAGRLEKKNAGTFAYKDATNVLHSLEMFLTFCRGSHTSPILLEGYDAASSKKLAVHVDRRISSYKRCYNLFPTYKFRDSVLPFTGFCKLHQDKLWHDPLEWAIFWYVESEGDPVTPETGILLTQAAFELLAWTYLVEDLKSISPGGFERLPASDKIRLLLARCGISMNIPIQTLQTLAKTEQWDDGPACFTEIRNALVHGNPTKREKIKKIAQNAPPALYEAWRMGQWYLELVILYLIGHRGFYNDRLGNGGAFGNIKKVPWAT